ncbi:MAG: hypothetical protein RLZZ505_3287 [Verrucomicrobiota bacterium]|jgi:hypothetical protein
MSDASDQPKLLGFAGHRMVTDKEALREAIRRELVAMKGLLGNRMIAISSAAAGADLIFLKSCVELRIPAIVILPFPEERFSEDFEDEEEWAMAQRLSGVALARYVAPGGKEAPEAYQIVSRLLLEWADAFIFAWNGEPQKGAGGTGETVEEARDLGIPSRVIDSRSLAARWETPPDPHRKARHGFHSRADLLDFLDTRFA